MTVPSVKGTPTTAVDSNGGTSSTIAVPSGGATDDLYVLAAVHYNDSPTPNAATVTGFTQAVSVLKGASSAIRITDLVKVYASDSGNFTVAVNASGYTVLGAFVVENVDVSSGAAAALDGSNTASGSGVSSANLPSITTSDADRLAIATVSGYDQIVSSTQTALTSAGWSEVFNADGGFFRVFAKDMASAGATGTASVAFDGSTSYAITVFSLVGVSGGASPQAISPTGPTVSVTPGTVTLGEEVNLTGPTVTVTAGTLTVTVDQPIAPTGPTVTVTAGSPTVVAANGLWPTTVNGTTKQIEDQNGNPWFGVGDTAWSIAGQLTTSGVDTYLDGIQAQGINLVMFNAPEPYFTDNTPAYRNANGDDPFTSGNDWTSSPNDAYWDHVEYIVAEAAAKGITCLICPQYAGFNDTEGWQNEIVTAYGSDSTAFTAYGEYLQARFVPYPNIMWLIGHDDTTLPADFISASALIAAELTTHLILPGGGESDTTGSTAWSGSGITFDVETVYDYDDNPGGDTATARTSGTVGFLEGKYEQEQSIAVGGQLLREQMWEPFCAGATFAIFGNNPRWHFESGKELYAFSGTWGQSLSGGTYDTGTVEVGYLADFLASVTGWGATAPDTTGTALTAGTGYARFDGSAIIVYSTAASSITLDTTEITGTGNVRVRRYDPTTGSFSTVAASEAQSSSRVISYPGTNSSGDTDWVYVVDSTNTQAVTPTGPTVTVTPGTVTVGLSVTPTGPTVTVTPGTVTVDLAFTLTGPTVTATAGTVTVTQGAQPLEPVGPTVTVTPGTPSIGLTVTLTGASVGVTAGSITVTQGLSLVPDGPTISVTPGTLTITTGAVDIAPTGPTITVTAGTVTVGSSTPVSPSGPTITVTAGTPSIDLAITLTAPTVGVTAGTLTVGVEQFITPTGPTVTVTAGVAAIADNIATDTIISVTYKERSHAPTYRERAYARTYKAGN